jgi:hypothetical protein
MLASKNKPFMLHYYWKVLEQSDKWKLRDEEAPPKKGACITLDDWEDSDDAKDRRNKGKPNRMRMERERENEKKKI